MEEVLQNWVASWAPELSFPYELIFILLIFFFVMIWQLESSRQQILSNFTDIKIKDYQKAMSFLEDSIFKTQQKVRFLEQIK